MELIRINNSKRDRRRTVRARCRAAAELQTADQTFGGDCTNLSLGGMLFIGPLLSVGHRVDVAIELAGIGSVHTQGEVLGYRRCWSGRAMAIRFVSLAQRDLSALSHFVSESSDRNGVF